MSAAMTDAELQAASGRCYLRGAVGLLEHAVVLLAHVPAEELVPVPELAGRLEYALGDFVQADALEVLAAPGLLAGFDVIHASPPCQHYSLATPAHRRQEWPDLIAPVRDALHAWGGIYVIENAEGAKRHLHEPFRLCGSSFGLRVRRHRWFESNAYLTPLPCEHAAQGTPVGIYGDHGDLNGPVPRPTGGSRGAKARNLADARDAIGIDWMGWRDLAESIPPAYTAWIGDQLIEQEVAA